MDIDSLENGIAKQILKDRALLIAQEKAETTTTTGSSLLVFQVGREQKYAIPYPAIDKVISEQKITPVPGVNPLFSGLLYYNAEVWPVISASVLFECKQPEIANDFILLRQNSNRYALSVEAIIGQIIYDELTELTQLSAEGTSKPSFIQGVYQTDITLVNPDVIFTLLETIQVDWNKP